MKNKGNRISLTTGLLLSMLAVYFGAICLINFSGVPSFYDTDMYADIYYAMKVWESKSLFPENWVFGNQLYAFSTPVLAAVFYGLLGSQHLAMGLAATIMSLLVIISFDWMLRPVLSSRNSRLIAVFMLMAVVLFCGQAIEGNIGWSMLFTMCSYYSGYAIAAFLAFGCYLRSDILSSGPGLIIFAITCILSFCSGVQSIRQTVVMVCPLVMVEFLRIISSICRKTQENRLDKQKILTVGLISLSNVLGLIVIRMVEVNQVEILGSIELNLLQELPGELKKCIISVCALLLNETAHSLAMMAFVLLICAVSGFLILGKGNTEEGKNGLLLMLLLLASVLMIAGIDVLTTMLFASRYYFMLFPLIGYLAAVFYDKGKRFWKSIFLILAVVLFGFSCAGELRVPCQQVLHREQDSSYEVSSWLVENGYTTIYSEWNFGEKVAIASGGKVTASFWLDPDRPFVQVDYLRDPSLQEIDPDICAYLFKGERTVEYGKNTAEGKGITLELQKYFPDSDIYIYTAPVNLLKLFT